MTRVIAEDSVQASDLLLLRDPVRRYLARTVHDEQELEDLVQETLLRVWEVRGRVGRAAAASYAVATARNLVQSKARARQVHARHAHRLHEPDTVDGPEVEALREEERLAAAQVARSLTSDDLQLLAPEVAEERSARRRSRLARTRARARVDYLLHLRRLQLPSARCRPVLEALSAGDRRQQERTGVAQHLLGCPVCAACAPALLARDRRAFGLVAAPLLLLEPLRRVVARAPRTATVAAAGTAVAVAAVLIGGVPGRPQPAALRSSPAPAAAPTVAPVVTTNAPPTPLQPAVLDHGQGFVPDLLAVTGRPVVATDVLVRSVPADEGFWIGPDDGTQVYVRLEGSGESPQTVDAGDLVSFRGSVALVTAAGAAGVSAAEGADRLRAQGRLLSVPTADLVVTRG